MNDTLQKTVKFLWATFLITFPFSLRWVIYESSSYQFGHFNPWVTAFFYLPELLLWSAFALNLYLSFRAKSNAGPANLDEVEKPTRNLNLPFLILLIFLFNATFITTLNGDLRLLAIFFLRLAEAAMIWQLIRSKLFPFKKIIQFLLAGALFQMLLSVFQLLLNRSLGLSFLGESVLSGQTYGVAKLDLASGAKRIRPYGTFLHANILAGYLLALLFLMLPHLKKSGHYLLPALFIIMIFLTGSRAALLLMIFGFFIVFAFKFLRDIRKIRLFLAGFFTLFLLGNIWLFSNADSIETSNSSWQERLVQTDISNQMFMGEPWGIGINQFTLQMELFSNQKLLPWEFQPVHNVYFLILNELGIQGFLLILILLSWGFFKLFYPGTLSRKDKLDYLPKIPQFLPFFLLLILASFDHFLWDSFAGWIIFVLAGSVFVDTFLPKPSATPK